MIYDDLDNKDDGPYRLIRSCANKCEESEREDINCCDGDLCNAASPSAAYSFVFALISGVVACLV